MKRRQSSLRQQGGQVSVRSQGGHVSLRQQGGQVVVEYILLMVVLIGVASSIVDFLKDQGVATKFIQDPWVKINGMIQCGNWSTCGVNSPAAGIHPNTTSRVLTLDPKQAN